MKIKWPLISVALYVFFLILVQNFSFYSNKESVLKDYRMQKSPEDLRVIPLYLGRDFIKNDLKNMIIETNSPADRANFLYLLGTIGDSESRKMIEDSLDYFKEDCETALLCLKALISIDGISKVKLKYGNYKLKCFFNQHYLDINGNLKYENSYIDIFEIIDKQIRSEAKYKISYLDIFSWWTDWKPDN